MVRGRRHLGSGDAAGTVEGGKHLGQADHLPADRCILVHDRRSETLIRQIQGGLQTCNPAPDNKCVKF